MQNSIFISYRRSDLSKSDANVIHEGLENAFGPDSVFLDTADLHGGDKWKQILNQAGTNAKVCLVVIGPKWLEKNQDGALRIKQDDDWVRKEIEYAIDKNLVIIPVLVNKAKIPNKEDLPDSIQTMLDSQALKIDLNDWATYKLRIVEELKNHLGNKVSNKEKKKISAILYLLSGLILVTIVGWWLYKSKTNDVTKPISTSTPECVSYERSDNLNTLFFPLITTDNQKIEYSLANKFSNKCMEYQISDETKVSEYFRDKPLTHSDQKTIAKKCNADLFFGGQLIQFDGKNQFDASFGLTHDTLQVLTPSAKSFTLERQNISLQELTGGRAIDSLYERVLQAVLGFVLVQKKDFDKAVKVLKDLQPEKIESDTFRNVIYRLMSDACYQNNKPDSAIMYLQKVINSNYSTDLELSKSILATEINRPDIAIASYNKLIDSSKIDKNILYEKRADQYIQIQEYKKAKEDYQQVKPSASPAQKQRVNTKVIEADKNISANNASISQVNFSNLTAIQKISISDKLLQNGETVKAKEILNTIPKEAVEFKKAEPLLMEAKLKLGDIKATEVPPAILIQNQRLNTEVIQKKAIMKKVN